MDLKFLFVAVLLTCIWTVLLGILYELRRKR